MTDSATLTWSVPECPFSVECSARVLDDIRLSVTDAFFSLPRGGAEIGGILLGKFDSGKLAIIGHAALDCEHAYGPSFVLSPPDEARLKDLLSTNAGDADSLRPVGWYHSHTRSEIFLSEADVAIHKRFFPEPWQVALVMKPHTFEPARIGFFFCEPDGSIHADASYREDALEALPIRQMPSGVPTAPPSNDPPVRRLSPDSASVPEPAPDLTIAAAPAVAPADSPGALPVNDAATVEQLPIPKFAVASATSARRWMIVGIGIVASLGIAGAAYQVRQMWLPQVVSAIRPAAPPSAPVAAPAPAPALSPALGLSTIDHDGQLQIIWGRDSSAVRQATDALLEIADGQPHPAVVQLDAAHLQTGSFTYARTTEMVDIKLILHQKNGPDLREATSFLGQLPDRKSAEELDAQRQEREESAKQAAKMKSDMNSQAAKTRRLEQEIQTMREEMRQQQRRMNSQVPDK